MLNWLQPLCRKCYQNRLCNQTIILRLRRAADGFQMRFAYERKMTGQSRPTLDSWYWWPHICGICSRKWKQCRNSSSGQTLDGLWMCRREVTLVQAARHRQSPRQRAALLWGARHLHRDTKAGPSQRVTGSWSIKGAEHSGNAHRLSVEVLNITRVESSSYPQHKRPPDLQATC